MQQTSFYELPFNNYHAQPMNSGEHGQVQYVDNMNMFPDSLPIYQIPFQQPSSYATAIQSSPYSLPIQQQPLSVNGNQNLSTKNPTDPGTPPFEKNKWPRKSVSLVCPRCGAIVETRVELEITIITFIGFAILCCFTCVLGWLALCLPACKKVTHYCPYCNSMLGVRPELR
ncbi:unnamed protein product [Rotaria sp. Silwood2]|nr:unnamed protein product [Rotaria sp. Silwood2]CAF2631775.1 unnamed protein product [Rotaria sp. Silwood2]CAF2876461.1 unnamed protein product [Rotaria sp. Silwood2]CAF3045412.1 unnamed protein product [Rotaria sp. Silwood2]CAF3973243.1 unnamed protein product [Rotaria sp. Silwood2]